MGNGIKAAKIDNVQEICHNVEELNISNDNPIHVVIHTNFDISFFDVARFDTKMAEITCEDIWVEVLD